MASKNKVNLIGNIGKDPEISHSKSGSKIAKFSVATSESKKKDDGTWEDGKTQWHNIVCFGFTADKVEKLGKGSQVDIEGKIDQSEYEKDGVKKYFTSIIAHSVLSLSKVDKATPPVAPEPVNDSDVPF